jgi:outer membrane protein TolC
MIQTDKSRPSPLPKISALLLTLLFLASGCVVGPRFKQPAAPDVTGYTPVLITTTTTPNVAGGEAQHLAEGGDIPGDWWTLFHSRPLNDLIARALKTNPDFKAAQAALLVARENVLAQGALTIRV